MKSLRFLLLSACVAAASASRLELWLDGDDGEFVIRLDGKDWLEGGADTRVAGLSTADVTLKKLSGPDYKSGSDPKFGAYTETSFTWGPKVHADSTVTWPAILVQYRRLQKLRNAKNVLIRYALRIIVPRMPRPPPTLSW